MDATQPQVLQSDSMYVTDTGQLHGIQVTTIDVYGNEIHVMHIVKDGQGA